MMNVRDLGRSAVDTWLRVARLPLDTVARILPNGDHGPRTPAALMIDRVDATIRDTVGRALRDEELQEDARRRRIAADERARALELRIEAQRERQAADARLAREKREIENRRVQAERSAQEQKAQADRERAERERRVEQAVATQEQVVGKVEQDKLAAAEKKAKKQRLQVLETQDDALDAEADALTVSDEAQRLRAEASKAKAARKGTA